MRTITGTAGNKSKEARAYGEPPEESGREAYLFPAYYAPYPSYEDEDEIDLVALWRTLTSHKCLILLTTLVVGALATTAGFVMTPVYRAAVLMAPVSPTQETGRLAQIADQFGGLAAMAGIDLGEKDADVEAAIATLKSREFTLAFMHDNQLLPVLFDDAWNPATKTWDVDDPKDIPTEWEAYKYFDKDVRSISRDKRAGLLTLAIEWKDRNLAARWANKLVARINRQQQQKAITEARKSIEFLKGQVERTSVTAVRQAIWRLVEAEDKKAMLANVREDYAFKVIDPAVPPDEGDFAKPKRKRMVALGVVVGLMLGVFLAFLRAFVQRQKGRAGRAED
jgi:uncharacterized protein involved in exopolysaccharide biosynthesis